MAKLFPMTIRLGKEDRAKLSQLQAALQAKSNKSVSLNKTIAHAISLAFGRQQPQKG